LVVTKYISDIQERVTSNVDIVKGFSIMVSGHTHLGHVIVFAVLVEVLVLELC